MNPPSTTDIPAFLQIPQAQRNASWVRSPPRVAPSTANVSRGPTMEDPTTTALRAELEAEKKLKTDNRIGKMLARKEEKEATRAGKVWCTRTAKWIEQ